MEDVKTTLDRVMEKKAEKQVKAAERKAEREEEGIVNHIIVEMLPHGLYKCRTERGPLPEVLKGSFTSIRRIQDHILRQYGTLDKMKVV